MQAQHNLCVVYVEKGLLEVAKDCLEKAVNLAPNEEYIKNHLNIVVKKLKSQSQKETSPPQ